MDNKPGKRKSRMNNIQSRMNSGSYDMAKFKANEKDLREKIAFFEKKDEKGELKDYMYARMEEAKAMYAQLLALKSSEPLAAAAAPMATRAPRAPKATAAAAAATAAPLIQGEDIHLQTPETIAAANRERNLALESLFSGTLSSVPAQMAATGVPKMTLKKLNRKRQKEEAAALAAASYVPPQFNPPPPGPATLPAPYGHYNTSGEFHVNGTVAPTAYNLGGNTTGAGAGGYGTAFNNLATYGNAVPLVRAPPTTTRRQRTPESIYNEYYEQVLPQFLPLPEFYDPYTGRKFAPEEDPFPPIEGAYYQLKDILKSARLKAASLRKKAARATKRRAKGRKGNNRFNAGLRIAIPPNTIPPTGQQLQPQENLY